MVKILDYFNIYPHPISLIHKTKSTFNSIYGIILSFLSYGIILSLVYYFSSDLIYMKNPKIKTNQSQINETIKLSASKVFNSLKLNLQIEFNCKNKSVEIEKLFNNALKISFKNFDGIENISEYFYFNEGTVENNKSNSSDYEYSYTISLKITKKTDLKQMFVQNNSFNFLNKTKKLSQIDIRLKNSLINIDFEFLRPKNITNYKISKVDFSFVVDDNTINTEDFNKSFNNLEKSLTLEKGESIQLIYSLAEIISDDNHFFSVLNSQFAPQVDFFTFYSDKFYSHPDFSKGNLMTIQFREVMNVYTRTYKKILDVLSELGGLFNPILMLGRLLVFNFNEKKYKINIMNSLYTDEDITLEIEKNKVDMKDNEFSKRDGYNNNKKSNINTEDIQTKKLKEKGKIENKFTQLEYSTYLEMKNSSNRSGSQNEKNKDESARSFTRDKNFLIENSRGKNLFKENLYPSNFIYKKNHTFNRTLINPNHILNNDEIIFNHPSYHNNYSILHEQIQDDQINKNKINKYLKLNKDKNNKLLRFTFSNIFFSLVCSKKMMTKKLLKKEGIYEKIRNKINLYFEITNLIRLYENFEKMKFILLNKNQMNCFNYMIHDLNYNFKKKEEEILFDLNRYFKKFKNDSFEKHIDESIKVIMKNEIKELIIQE